MFVLLSIVAGTMFGAGVYLLLRRSLVKLVLGLVLMGHAANLVVFVAGGVAGDAPPLVPDGASVLPAGSADPLPQALVLTAIVIGFAVVAFTAVLVRRAAADLGTDDTDALGGEQ